MKLCEVGMRNEGKFPDEDLGLIRGSQQNWTKEGLEESAKPFHRYSTYNFSLNWQKNAKTMSIGKEANHQPAFTVLM